MRVRRLLKQDNLAILAGKPVRKSAVDVKVSDVNMFNKDSLIESIK
jgi:hypothetical protein